MKIEMGESLIYSWLKHIKECQITQLNWKVSNSWNTTITEDIIELMKDINEKFDFPFGNIKSIEHLVKQSEVDVLGFDFNTNTIYGVDVAFHTNGLGYKDNVNKVTKKIFRTLLTLDIYFDNTYAKEVIFATPKINPQEYEKLSKRIDEINEFLENKKQGTKISFISNIDFENKILNPILTLSDNVADTSELFLRSYQLTQLFNKKQPRNDLKNKKKELIKANNISEIKIGKIVQNTFHHLFKNNLLENNEISNLIDKDYSKNIFDMNFPILKKLDLNEDVKIQRKINGYDRYYAKIFGEKYLLCNDWYPRNKKLFEQWLMKIKNPNLTF